jgi:hypothetical protein
MKHVESNISLFQMFELVRLFFLDVCLWSYSDMRRKRDSGRNVDRNTRLGLQVVSSVLHG